MTRSLSFIRAAALVAAVAIGGAACASSTAIGPQAVDAAIATSATAVVQAPAPIEAAPVETVAGEPASDVVEVEPVEPAESENSTEAPTGSGVVEVVFDDGRSWTLASTDCRASEGQAVDLNIGAEGDGTLALSVISTRPLGELTNADAEQIFIATFVDDEDTLYVFEDPESVESGADGSVRFSAKVHSNIWYALGDTPAAIATISC